MNDPKDLIETTANYLYHIDGDCSPELYGAIALLRQLINEEFLDKNKTVSSQFIFDIINPAVQALIDEARIDEAANMLTLLDTEFAYYAGGKPYSKAIGTTNDNARTKKVIDDRIKELCTPNNKGE